MTEDHGRVDDLDAYFRTAKYRNQVFGLRFNSVFKLMGDYLFPAVNGHVDGIRTQSVQ